jgi:hypothetical protein
MLKQMSGGNLRGLKLRGLEFGQKAADNKKASSWQIEITGLNLMPAGIYEKAFNGFRQIRQLPQDLKICQDWRLINE